VPLALSSLAWATVPRVASTNGMELEGAYVVAALAGVLSTALTAPITCVVLAAIQRRRRLSMPAYVGIILAVGLPALAFEALVLSASAMGIFIGHWMRRPSEVTAHVVYAATFLTLYTAIGIATYPFARRGVIPAALAAVTAGAVIVFIAVYRVMFAH
jgi:hypothetical protein